MPDLSSIVFLLLFLTFLVPMFTQRMLATRRYRAIRKLERVRGSRVITTSRCARTRQGSQADVA